MAEKWLDLAGLWAPKGTVLDRYYHFRMPWHRYQEPFTSSSSKLGFDVGPQSRRIQGLHTQHCTQSNQSKSKWRHHTPYWTIWRKALHRSWMNPLGTPKYEIDPWISRLSSRRGVDGWIDFVPRSCLGFKASIGRADYPVWHGLNTGLARLIICRRARKRGLPPWSKHIHAHHTSANPSVAGSFFEDGPDS